MDLEYGVAIVNDGNLWMIISVTVCVRIQNIGVHVLSPAKVAVNALGMGFVLFVYRGIVKESSFSCLYQVPESFPVLCLVAPIRLAPIIVDDLLVICLRIKGGVA